VFGKVIYDNLDRAIRFKQLIYIKIKRRTGNEGYY
jgi:hypothetical protein